MLIFHYYSSFKIVWFAGLIKNIQPKKNSHEIQLSETDSARQEMSAMNIFKSRAWLFRRNIELIAISS